MDEFLPWIKDLYARLPGRTGVCNLMNSGIREPAGLLRELLFAQRDLLERRLALANEWGHPALRQAVARRYALPADKEVVPTAGATAGFWLVCEALLSPGDRALVETPVYDPLRQVPARRGAVVDCLPRRPETGYGIDPEELAARVTPQTRLVVLTNLHNPTGAVLEDAVLRQAAEAARERNPDVRFVVDDTFHDFIHDRQPSAARLGPAFITINTLTKVYGLGLLRAGWVVAEPAIAERIRLAWLYAAGIGSRLTEALASVALDHVGPFEAHWQAVLAENRPLLEAHLGPLVEEGLLAGEMKPAGCVCFPRVKGLANVAGLTRQLAERRGVHVVPGTFFGAPDHIRLGFGGDPAVLAEGLRRLAEELRAQC